MSDHVKLAIIGSGPGGLTAAVTAARCGVDHVLLERTDHLSDTIFKYQKGKRVMAHPIRLPLLGEVPFEEGSREDILGGWDKSTLDAHVNVVYGAEVTLIQRGPDRFTISISGGRTITADLVILAIGLQGNIRKLAIPGAEHEFVQYQLDDPDAYSDERIIVVGAGDAGIENAVALAKQNDVSIINVAPDFSRAKPGNVADVEKLVRGKVIRAYHNTKPKRIDDGALVVDTPEGELLIPCDRIIARIGAIAPRKFLEDCGIKLPSKDPGALPELTEDYESNVPGMYIIGALAGYTLIKQAMNQGFELARRLAGQPVEPADEELLRQRFKAAFPNMAVRDVLTWLRERVPILAGLTVLQLREAMLDSEIVRFNTGETVFNAGDYTNSLWNVAEGAASVHVPGARADEAFHIEAGEFFGELGLLSGRRRSATVTASAPSIMVEIPRRVMRRLETSVEAIQRELDRVALRRIVHTTLARHRPIAEVEDIIAASTLKAFKAGEAIVTEGEPIDAMYILRSGSAIVSAREGAKVTDLGFVSAGDLFGERGFLGSSDVRAATVRTTIASEAVRIDAAGVRAAMGHLPELHTIFAEAVRAQMDRSLRRTLSQASHIGISEVETAATAFLVSNGIGEATNAFFINESLCTRCGNCETACAATHEGVSRVSRDNGTSAVSILLPLACRHCENPHCMTDCPPDAISRQPSGEVVVNQETCIGCSNCANNCPYGVINMAYPAEPPRGGLGSLLAMVGLPVPRFGHGKHEASHAKKAYKCDLCRGNAAGPACVNACPTGAAVRVDPDSYMAYLRQDRGAG